MSVAGGKPLFFKVQILAFFSITPFPECQAFPFQRLPQVEAVFWVQGEEMFHSLLIGCKNPTNRPTKDEK